MKNFDDIPNILSSISWQLKRIADALEGTAQTELERPKPNPQLRRFLKSLAEENDQE